MTAHIDSPLLETPEMNTARARGALHGQVELVLWELERDDMFPPQCSPRAMQELRRCLEATREAENAQYLGTRSRFEAASQEAEVARLIDATEVLLENHRRAVGGQDLGL